MTKENYEVLGNAYKFQAEGKKISLKPFQGPVSGERTSQTGTMVFLEYYFVSLGSSSTAKWAQ